MRQSSEKKKQKLRVAIYFRRFFLHLSTFFLLLSIFMHMMKGKKKKKEPNSKWGVNFQCGVYVHDDGGLTFNASGCIVKFFNYVD